MFSNIKKVITILFGVASISREKAKGWVDENKVVERGEKEKDIFKGIIDQKIQNAFHKINIPTKADLNQLEKRIQELEQQQ
jgi:polyhydroxyalkanoate synthesis regulator phasin